MSGYIMDLRKIVGHRTLLQVGASVIVEDKQGRILLQKRQDNHSWAYHGGSVELDENVEDAAKRELLEETGLIAEKMEFLGTFSGPETHFVYPNGDSVSNVDCVYICSSYKGEIRSQEGEVEELKFFALRDLPDFLFSCNRPALRAYCEKKTKPQGVIFDMDGIIFDSERLVIECWKEVAEKYGIEGVEETLMKCLGLTRDATERIFLDRYGEDFPYKVRKKEQSDLFFDKYGEGRLPLKKGVRELLQFLKEEKIPVALASSTRSEVVIRQLRDAGILPFFSAVICGDMVEHSKPHPEIFLKACMELGIDPVKAIAIEDSFNGIRSAAAGRMRPFMVPDLLAPTEEIAELSEFVFPDLLAVRDYLDLKGRII